MIINCFNDIFHGTFPHKLRNISNKERNFTLFEKNKIIYQMVQKPHKTDDSIKSYLLVNVRGTFLRDSLYTSYLGMNLCCHADVIAFCVLSV